MVRLVTNRGQIMERESVADEPMPESLVYLDLLNPTRAEETQAEGYLHYQLPTREEMQEIEESSRLYSENGALYMTAWVTYGLDTSEPDNTSVTFVLSPATLTTVRYANPQPFRNLPELLRRQGSGPLCSDAVFLKILEAIVARIADGLQSVEGDLKRLSQNIFRAKSNGTNPQQDCDLNEVVKLLGRRYNLIANMRESLLSLSRMLQFYLHHASQWMPGELAPQFRSVARDVQSLDEYTNQQSQEMGFLLDSTLGLINIQQNQIIKIFTIASVLFLPPTLIGTIYGMNFKILPETAWTWGYPFALLLMVISGILPIFYFKRRNLL